MSTVRALLVGINQYDFPDIDLTGAINDSNAFAKYLKETIPESDLSLMLLNTREKTRKAEIVNAIRTHFGKGRKDDTLIFHFSGHGCQEPAHPAFARFVPGGGRGEKNDPKHWFVQILSCRINPFLTWKSGSFFTKLKQKQGPELF